MRYSIRSGLVVLILGLSSHWVLAASTPSAPLALTISGGASLGSYEAGFLYYVGEFNKLNQLKGFSVITGASAGAINGMLMALSQCDSRVPDYEDSIFWKFWVPLGMSKLNQQESTSSRALFSKAGVSEQIDVVLKAMQRPFQRSCEATLGVALNRKEPAQIQVTDRLTAPILSETFNFRISRSAGPTSAFRFSNLTLRNKTRQFHLPFTGNFEGDFKLITHVFLASAAFPGAIDPESVSYCLKDSSSQGENCAGKQILADEFIDGGVINNDPLRDALILVNEKTGKGTSVLLLDPNQHDYPSRTPIVEEKNERELLPYFFQIASSLVQSARRSMISRLLDEEPKVAERVMHSNSKMPLSGSGLYGFLGFFEEDFRRSDFIYGMVEARRYLLDNMGRLVPGRKARFPEEVGNKAWARFKCIGGIFEGADALGKECGFLLEEEERNLAILLQANLNRLYYSCGKKDSKLESPISHCLRASVGKDPPELILGRSRKIEGSNKEGVDKKEKKEEGEDETDFAYFFRMLAKYQFRFRDLGLERNDAGYGLQALHQELFHLTFKIADRQSEPERSLIKIAAHPMLSSITTYTSPRSILYLGVGPTQEIGWSSLIERNRIVPTPFRYDFGLRSQGLPSYFVDRQISFTPFIGVEYEIPFFTPSQTLFQVRTGVQVGRQFGTGDNWGSGPCVLGGTEPLGWSCSGWEVGPVLAISFLDRIRIQTEWFFYPFSPGKPPFQFSFQLGYQFLLDE